MTGITLLLCPLAHADSLQVAIEIHGSEHSLIEAVHQSAPTPQRPLVGATPLGQVQAVDAEGRVVATSPLPDPRLRSIIDPENGGQALQLDQGWARVELDWPKGAVRVQLGPSWVEPRGPRTYFDGTELVQVHSSGDASERLNMVFLADGYTEDELDVFAADVDRIASYMFSEIEPYGSYESAFNVWRIDRASAESGASHLEVEPHVLLDTAYGCFYGCAGIARLICCDDSEVVGDVNGLIPEADGIMVLVNDPTYGGSGGFTYATSYTEGTTAEMVASHELGHSLIGLWDEYDYGTDGGNDGGPNCSTEADGSDWEPWLGEKGVDSFSTCSYQDLYRPTRNSCMMNSLQGSYCPICREETVRVIYDHLPSLIASSSSPEGVLELESEPLLIRVEATLPEVDSLSWEWTLEGEWIGEGPELELEACGESGRLTFELRDLTHYVRTDPDALLMEELSWSLVRPDCVPGGSNSDSDAELLPESDSGTRLSTCGCNMASPAFPGALIIPLAWWRRRSRTACS